jgi:HTH-type transcriptional regulator/antitoxin HipB
MVCLSISQTTDCMSDYHLRTAEQLSVLLQAFRKEAGLTQNEVALRLGVTQQTYSTLERNAESVCVARRLKLLGILGPGGLCRRLRAAVKSRSRLRRRTADLAGGRGLHRRSAAGSGSLDRGAGGHPAARHHHAAGAGAGGRRHRPAHLDRRRTGKDGAVLAPTAASRHAEGQSVNARSGAGRL